MRRYSAAPPPRAPSSRKQRGSLTRRETRYRAWPTADLSGLERPLDSARTIARRRRGGVSSPLALPMSLSEQSVAKIATPLHAV